MRIALIHALAHSIAPIEDAFRRGWPTAERVNLLDDSLSRDLLRQGSLSKAMETRFLALCDYAIATGADAVLFTCSAFGPCIELCAERYAPVPVLRPNEAMVEEACASGGKIGLIATFAPTLASMPAEFGNAGIAARLHPVLAPGALAALDAGDGATHDALIAQAAATLSGCDVIALAQFSMARAAGEASSRSGRRVLTTPDSSVRKLRRMLLPHGE